jgi:ABC-type uncharacterized transport system YnjBCD substrate-binding protein
LPKLLQENQAKKLKNLGTKPWDSTLRPNFETQPWYPTQPLLKMLFSLSFLGPSINQYGNKTLSHYLANKDRKVPENKMPLLILKPEMPDTFDCARPNLASKNLKNLGNFRMSSRA